MIRFLLKSATMWSSISNLLTQHAKNAELELGGPRGASYGHGLQLPYFCSSRNR